MSGLRSGRRTGSADLPLHGGHVPPWLAERMTRLGRLISETIVHHYGRQELLRRLAHPFWFQSFGAVMGMDWHSSGITTSVMGSLKRGLAPLQDELGIYVCGGRGRHSRRTPQELIDIGVRTGLDGLALARASRLAAKVDSAAIQDGFDLYLHSFVLADDGSWVVIQQGMDAQRRQARRYHWLSEGLTSFVEEPHAAIAGLHQGDILNLTDHRARAARASQVALAQAGPDQVVGELRKLRSGAGASQFSLSFASAGDQPPLEMRVADSDGSSYEAGDLPACDVAALPHLHMPAHHNVRATDVFLRRLHGTLAAAADAGTSDFPELLLTPGMGARSIAALAMVSEVVHGAPSRFEDPARFAFAHGGKDGHPFPVPLAVYDETIVTLKRALELSKLGNDDKLSAMRRLDEQARMLERHIDGEDFAAIVDGERAVSQRLGGATVFTHDGAGKSRVAKTRKPPNRQLRLF